MCGIAGFIDFRKQTSPEVLKAMTDTIIHRGPDDSGDEYYTTNNSIIGLGFRRLSIIELSALGHQPMKYTEAGLTIIFNGEVYNYKEIRQELTAAGYSFNSESDTEVILKSYAKWGADCVSRFIGMFAVAIYDAPNNKITFFRDRAGVKPLYYYHHNGLFLFGSELKSFHKHPSFKKDISFGALSQYFQRGYISAPYSIFEHTFKLLPGHYLELNLNSQEAKATKYWDVADCYNQTRLTDVSYSEAKAHLTKLMQSAFNYRMIADVPVGVFLSGGYDSTAVTALLQSTHSQKIKTFTIGFDVPEFNEAEHAKAVAKHLGTDHHEYICTHKDALDMVEHLPHIYDEPFGDTSAIPTTLVSRMARQQVTVALSADGGDEIFAGYPKYFNAIKRLAQLQNIPAFAQSTLSALMPQGLHSDIATQNKWSKLKDYLGCADDVKRFDIISQACTFYETEQLLLKQPLYLKDYYDSGNDFNSSTTLLGRLTGTEYRTYMADDILHKVDRATMSVSLEGREPFLDQRIIEYAARLPDNFKWRNGVGKYILKDIVHDYVPRTIMERPKMGFGVPLEHWLRKELKEVLIDTVNEQNLKSQQVFNVRAAMKIRDSYLAGKKVEFGRMSYLFLFQLWYAKWMQ